MMLLGRGDGHLPPGEPLDTPSPREQQPLTPLADGRRGTASALALSEAENDRGYFYRRGMRGGARKHSYALFRGARQAKNSAHGGARKFTSLTLADGAVMVLPQW
jgi:hypothetical protein